MDFISEAGTFDAFGDFNAKRCYNIFDTIVFSKFVFCEVFFEDGFTKAQRIADDQSYPNIRNPNMRNFLAMPLNVNEHVSAGNADPRC